MSANYPTCSQCSECDFDRRNPAKMGMCRLSNKAVRVAVKTTCKHHPKNREGEGK